jgi:NADH-quinone oxidoreductase subunit N
MIAAPDIDLVSLAPVLTLSAFGFAVLIWDLFIGKDKTQLIYISLMGLFLTAVCAFSKTDLPAYSFSNTYLVDNLSVFCVIIFTLSSGLAILLSANYNPEKGIEIGEYYCLILFCTVGMIVLSSAVDLILIFIGIEVVSISLYVLAGIRRDDLKSNEAALKYFLLGAFASGFLLYGMSLIYGFTGTTNLKGIMTAISAMDGKDNSFLVLGCILFIVGFGFKIAAAPFHMWSPDVYQGAPTPITAFMAVGPKAASLVALFRVFHTGVGGLDGSWEMPLVVVAVASMTLGNLGAIVQTNIKRLIAYSSISHVGYILMAVIAKNSLASSSLLFYMLTYTFMIFGVFGIIIILGKKGDENLEIEGYCGLSTKYPLLALAMAMFMLSLGGLPPLAGFVAKFYIFSAVLKEGHTILVTIAVLNSVISFYYYLKIIVNMYFRDANQEFQPNFQPLTLLVVIIALVGILDLGIFPGPVISLAENASLF